MNSTPHDSPPGDPLSGTFSALRTLGPYTLLRELGRGTFGVVFLARRGDLPRDFALKVLTAGSVDMEQTLRFKREVQLGSQLEHPDIVGIVDTGRHGPYSYYVMEYAPGETLQDRLDAGPLPSREAAWTVSIIARAVAFAHQRSILHRDLKPGNVILDHTTARPRVTDFGLARATGQESLSLTRTGETVGTPAFMSPEQLRAQRDLDPRSDVYALGAILYACLTGRPPFLAPNFGDLAAMALYEPLPPPSTLRPDLPEDLDAICLQALARDREDRFANAEELAWSLETWSQRNRRATHLRRYPLALTASLALGAAVGLGVAFALPASQPDPPTPPAEPADFAPDPTTLLTHYWERTRNGAPYDEALDAWQAVYDTLEDPDHRRRWELERADLARRRGRYPELYVYTDALLDADPATAAHARVLRLFASARLRDVPSALDEAQRLADLDPFTPWHHIGLGFQAIVEPPAYPHVDAVLSLRTAVEALPELPYLKSLCAFAIHHHDLVQARDLVDAAARQRPDDPHVAYVRFLVDDARGEPRSARNHLAHALDLTRPDSPLSWLNEALTHDYRDRNFLAVATLARRLLQRDPRATHAQLLLGLALLHQDDLEAARAPILDALRDDPANVRAILNSLHPDDAQRLLRHFPEARRPQRTR